MFLLYCDHSCQQTTNRMHTVCTHDLTTKHCRLML